MTRRWRRTEAVALVALLFAATDAAAFKLHPHATTTESKVRYLEQSRWVTLLDRAAGWITDHFSTPVHEEITHRIWGCDGDDAATCLAPLPLGHFAPPAVLYGVQWNDDPPFALTSTRTKECPLNTTIRLPNYSKCWVTLFKDADKRARGGEHFDYRSDAALIYRVHFGDMQFLHAMASWDGEKVMDTKARIMAWAEFAYATAIGKISASTPISAVQVPAIPLLFAGKGYGVESLFSRGLPEYRSQIEQVALGSLMHIVEDSFARGHVARDEPTGEACPAYPQVKRAGRVLAFHAFNQQDQRKHAAADSPGAFQAHFISQAPNVVDVGRALKSLYESKAPWELVRSVLDQCVFEVAAEDLDMPAGPGADFRRD